MKFNYQNNLTKLFVGYKPTKTLLLVLDNLWSDKITNIPAIIEYMRYQKIRQAKNKWLINYEFNIQA